MLAVNEMERAQLLAELRSHGGAVLIDRTASRLSDAQLRDLVRAAREQTAYYESAGFQDEGAGAPE